MRMRILGLIASCSLLGCSLETDSSESVAEVRSAQLGPDGVAYFRSNATGWGVNDATRLSPLGHPQILARTYLVTEAWMVSDADTASLTITNQFNGWGTQQTFDDLANTQRLIVPRTEPVVASPPGGDPHFKVDYARLGRHRIVANFRIAPATISIDSEADICAQTVCPAGTRCVLLPDASTSCEPAS